MRGRESVREGEGMEKGRGREGKRREEAGAIETWRRDGQDSRRGNVV